MWAAHAFAPLFQSAVWAKTRCPSCGVFQAPPSTAPLPGVCVALPTLVQVYTRPRPQTISGNLRRERELMPKLW